MSQRPPLLFEGDDTDWVHHPYTNALVVEVLIWAYNVYRVLVDTGSFVNHLAYTNYQKMGFLDKDLTATDDSLYGFANNLVLMKGKIKL